MCQNDSDFNGFARWITEICQKASVVEETHRRILPLQTRTFRSKACALLASAGVPAREAAMAPTLPLRLPWQFSFFVCGSPEE